MKTLALLLSFYVLSLTAVPAVALLREKFKSECSESCSKKETQKDSDCCEKQSCSTFSCCYKIVYMVYPCKENLFFTQYRIVKNSFGYTNPILTLHSFDIWQPPRIA